MNKFMELALKEAMDGVLNKDGGPFGCVIVKDGEVVGCGHNQVVDNSDPTCHGEMQAIRDACNNLGTFDLSGCELYTTGKPCGMCMCAIIWANIKTVYYACDEKDAAEIGFRDDMIRNYIVSGCKDESILKQIEIDKAECKSLFDLYKNTNHENY